MVNVIDTTTGVTKRTTREKFYSNDNLILCGGNKGITIKNYLTGERKNISVHDREFYKISDGWIMVKSKGIYVTPNGITDTPHDKYLNKYYTPYKIRAWCENYTRIIDKKIIKANPELKIYENKTFYDIGYFIIRL